MRTQDLPLSPGNANMDHRPLPDEDFPPQEQFPRRMTIVLEESINPAYTEPRSVLMTIDGNPTGDPLRDNNLVDDGYRFHDVFHLAHAAILGWSPVLRALMKRKRRSDPRTFWREDARRAMYIEEGIVAILFAYASRRKFLEGAQSIEPWTVNMILDMTRKLEVAGRTKDQWEEAILTGYAHWRNIRRWGGGKLQADLSRKTLDLYLPAGAAVKAPTPT